MASNLPGEQEHEVTCERCGWTRFEVFTDRPTKPLPAQYCEICGRDTGHTLGDFPARPPSVKDSIGDRRAKTIAVALLLAPLPLAFYPALPWWTGAVGIPMAFAFVGWWK